MPERSNLILISLDTTRADHLGCYGWHRNTSPHLDRLAEGGTVFTQAFSPWIPTHPAHTTLMTGCDVMQHQVVAQGAKVEPSAGIRMLAELLKAQGYWTGAADNLGKWFTRGFDLYETYQWARDPEGGWRKGEAVTRSALKVLDEASRQDRPFFLFFHYWDPHTPYLPPAPFDRMFYGGNEKAPALKSMEAAMNFPPFMHYFRSWMDGVTDIEFPKAQYDAEIAYMDFCLRHVFQRLEELRLTERTLLVITADHGEELDEHEMWFDHHGLYDTNVRVPLILSQPGTVPAGRRADGLVRLVDVVPTVLDALGLGDPGLDYAFQGRSFAPALSGTPDHATTDRLFLTEDTWMKKRALRTSEWKLIAAVEHPDLHGRSEVELYHLPSDPGEQVNLAEDRPEVVRELRADLDGWVELRMRETGLPDPIVEQPIALRSIGTPPVTQPAEP
jgi:arylsulfatase A-like enzyme